MAKLKEYLQVGQIRKSHGLDGLIKMTLKADFTHVIDKTDHFFIEENGQKLPLFIEKQVFDGQDYIVKFEDIDNPQDATQLSAKAIFMDKAVLEKLIDYKSKEKDLPFDITDLIGYVIKDNSLEDNLEIIDIQQFPRQVMATVELNGKEMFLPLSDELIALIDHNTKLISTAYPEGIFDL